MSSTSNTMTLAYAKNLLANREFQLAVGAFGDLLTAEPENHMFKLLRGIAKVELARQTQLASGAIDGLGDLTSAFRALGVVHKSAKVPSGYQDVATDGKIAELRALAMLERFDELRVAFTSAAELEGIVKRREPGLFARIESAPKRIREIAQSKNIRDAGNQFLAAAKAPLGGEVPARIVSLNRAIAQYDASVKTSDLVSVRSSALRNTAVAYHELALLHLRAYPGTAAQNTVRSFFEKALISFSNALSVGKSVQNSEWTDRVLVQQQTCTTEMLDFMSETYEEMMPRFQSVHSIAQQTSGQARVVLSFHAGSLLFHIHCGEAVSGGDKEDYDQGLEYLISRISSLERAAASLRFALDIDLTFEPHQLGPVLDIRERAADTLGSVLLHLTALEGEKAIFQGDNLLLRGTCDAEELDVELVIDALDKYILAIRIASDGSDLETESIACSRVADLFDRVLKNLDKAHDFAKRSVEAALACKPRTFEHCSWFRTAGAIVKRFQEKIIAEENEAKSKEREPYMKELKPHLDELTSKRREAGQPKTFLTFIYDKYPPGPGKTLATDADMDNQAEKKSVLVKAILHYHPDKTPQGSDQRTAILREEITKLLNSLYEVLVKGNLDA